MKSLCPGCLSNGSFRKALGALPSGPVHQNRLYYTRDEALQTARGPFELALCHECGLVSNSAVDPQLYSYDSRYENAQHHSPYFNRYLEDLAEGLIISESLNHKTLLEIGCGDGSMLSRFCDNGRNIGFGFDPAYRGPNTVGTMTFVSEMYTAKHATIQGDFVYARHVLEHVPEPLEFLKLMATATRDGGLWFLEVPDFRWVLANDSVWDLFYEHCNYFTTTSLTALANRVGFEVQRGQSAFEGQYLWVTAKKQKTTEQNPTQKKKLVSDILQLEMEIQSFIERFDAKRRALRENLTNALKQGVGVLWGAGAKGVTLLNTLAIDHDVLPYVVDINPNKQNKYIPGTGQKIIPPEFLPQVQPTWVMLMNPNYKLEVREALNQLNLSKTVILDI